MSQTVVIGGSTGIGREIARRHVGVGNPVVITSRDPDRAREVAGELGPDVVGLAVDLAQPTTIAKALAPVGAVDHLVVTAIDQTPNRVAEFDVEQAVRMATIKLVGYTEAIRVLRPRMGDRASVVLFGGLARDRPYPGSTMVTAVNGGVTALVRTLAVELAPLRVNAVHPGVVGDSPKWRDVVDHPHVTRTPVGRLVTMEEVAEAVDFLLANGGVNAQNLVVDGGVLAT